MVEEASPRFWEPGNVDILSDLTTSQVARVTSLGCPIDISAGWNLGVGGDPADHVYIIMEGKAELWARSGIGPLTLRQVGPGESFPLATLVGSEVLITSATAVTDMRVLAVPRIVLLSLFEQEPEIGMKIYRAIASVLAKRYRLTLEHLTASAQSALKAADFWVNV